VYLWHFVVKQQRSADSRTPSKKAMMISSHETSRMGVPAINRNKRKTSDMQYFTFPLTAERCFSWQHSPFCSEVFILMLSFSLASTFPLLLTHSTEVALWSFTVRVAVLLTAWSDTAVITEYSLWFFNSGHSMVGKGNPSLAHTQVRTPDWTSHTEGFKIFENPVSTQAESQGHTKMLIVWRVERDFLLNQSTYKSRSRLHTSSQSCPDVVLYRCTVQSPPSPH